MNKDNRDNYQLRDIRNGDNIDCSENASVLDQRKNSIKMKIKSTRKS